MERYELIVIGAGPSGLSAAIEAAKLGMKTIVFDENENTADVFYSAYKNINELSALLLENTKSERFVFTGKSDNALFENCRLQKCGMIKSLDKNHKIPDDVYIGITLS